MELKRRKGRVTTIEELQEREKRYVVLSFVEEFARYTVVAFLMVCVVLCANELILIEAYRPLFDLALLDREINYYKECESKYAGYTEITKYSDKVTELEAKRQETFYDSKDPIVSYLSTRNSLIRMFLLVTSGILMPVITLGSLLLICLCYSDIITHFKTEWKKVAYG